MGAAAVSFPLKLFSCQKKDETKPNIIYILADDLGYGDLGCYGQKEIQTPHLDKMAEEGMLFTDHYAGSTVCAPSRCCLMTGLHTGHALVRGNARQSLRPDDLTVAEILKEQGYATGLIGKWGLGEAGSTGAPNRKGFDYFFGYLNQARAHNYYPDYLWKNEEKYQLKNEVIYKERKDGKKTHSAATKRVNYSHDLFTDEAINFVEQKKNQPFFLYLAFTIPHANNEAHLVNRHGMEVPDYGIYKDKEWPEPQKGHAAMISRMDHHIGKLMAKLKSLGINKNTIVMFTSDNGPHREGGNDPHFNNSNGALKGIKRNLYDGGIRVPMIAYWEGKIKRGSKTDLISAFWDVLPTCTEIAGAPVPGNVDGLSMLPTMLGQPEKQKKHDYLYWEFHWGRPTKQAVRMDQWKAVRKSPIGKFELYNIKNDIGEENDIASLHPEVVSKIEKYVQSVRTESDFWKLIGE
ncbi:arylsulfatase [candidate division KSB1 bacterium]|nr:arylsulfatase [candidate division KSB1 bacterium]MBL7094504.1 arylsulfatase [candidate division KSB1 bacterium]